MGAIGCVFRVYQKSLFPAYAKDFGATSRASALCCGAAILKGDLLRIAYFSFSPALEAIGFHRVDLPPKVRCDNIAKLSNCQEL